MLKIATHDSATGEKGKGIISWLFTPFARTQSKTLHEQYLAGCRMFDIRVRKCRNGQWRCAHGFWISSKTVDEILNEMDIYYDAKDKTPVYVTITYEGPANEKLRDELLGKVKEWQAKYTRIVYGPVAIKFGNKTKGVAVKYDYIYLPQVGLPKSQSKFLKLDGRSWHTYIPIPWLWKTIYYDNPTFNDEIFTYVDFL